MKIQNIAQLEINPDKWYLLPAVVKMANLIKDYSQFNPFYHIKKGTLNAVKSQPFGMGQQRYRVLGKDLITFIQNKYF